MLGCVSRQFKVGFLAHTVEALVGVPYIARDALAGEESAVRQTI
jgi:hypothetical protein